jgi:hypothetical protein
MTHADAVLIAHQMTQQEQAEPTVDRWHYHATLVMDGRTYAVAVSDADGHMVGLLPL